MSFPVLFLHNELIGGGGAVLPHFIMDGDSLTYGVGVRNPDPNLDKPEQAYPGRVVALFNDIYGYVNDGNSGYQLNQMDTDAAGGIDNSSYSNKLTILFIWGGTNDLAFGGQTPAQAFARLRTYVQNRAATSKYDYIVVLNTIARSGGVQSNIDTYNGLITSDWATLQSDGADYLVDLAELTFFDEEADTGNQTVYGVDTIHLNRVGYDAVARKVILDAVNPIMTAEGYATVALPSFDATDFSGLTVHVDGQVPGSIKASGVAVSDTDPVDEWEDQSGNGNDLTAASSDRFPLYDATNQALDFDGNTNAALSDRLTKTHTTGINFNNTMTGFVVLTPAATQPGAFRNILTKYSSPNGWLLQPTGTTSGYRLYIQGTALSFPGTNNFSDGITLLSFMVDTGDVWLAVNDQDKGTATYTHGSGFGTTGTLALGCLADGSNAFDGLIHEVLLYNTAFDNDEFNDIRVQLCRKWDINSLGGT